MAYTVHICSPSKYPVFFLFFFSPPPPPLTMSPINNILLTCTSLALLSHAQTFLNYSSISNTSTSACPGPGGAHIIIARASTEPLGYGVIGFVKDRVLALHPASNAEYVVYPATLTDYITSEAAGVVGMKALVENFLARSDCTTNTTTPPPPLVLMGYSQGAQVVNDYLSGQNLDVIPHNSTLESPASASTWERVAAAITMGDPSINITHNPFHIGNSTRSGLFPRQENSSAVLNQWEAKLQSYCDALDPYCASAGNFDNISVHLGYVQEYGEAAARFVVQKIHEYYDDDDVAANGSNSTPTTPLYTGAAARTRGGEALTAMTVLLVKFLSGL